VSLLELLTRHSEGRLSKIWLTSLASGFLGATSIAVAAIATAGDRLEPSLVLGLVFLAGLALMFICSRWAARALIEAFEEIQRHFRDELAAGLRRAPLRRVEVFSEQYGRAIGDLTFISAVSTQLVMLISHGAFLIGVTFIIGVISAKALLIWLVTCAMITAWLLPKLRDVGEGQAEQSSMGWALHANIDELLDGFKQLKLDPESEAWIARDILDGSRAFYSGQAGLSTKANRVFTVSAALFFVVGMGRTVFALPDTTFGLAPQVSYNILIMLSLAIGPLFGFLQTLPVMTRVEVSSRAVIDVLEQLTELRGDASGSPRTEFEIIELQGLQFRYEAAGSETTAESGFVVGPITLSIRRGELVLVTGGNGSGKTTLMKMLLGLYPCEGLLRCDGQVVTEHGFAGYRELFSSIFAEPFSFDRLYGLDVERERVEALLERFGILDVVQFDGQRFGHLKLSSGQRMRLAMVVALLEDRPICVFDEWTANQDPETTWMYYDTLLPELLSAGKTVVAVSHDDRFFSRADHLIALERGQVVIDRFK
jgi:putative ATP-binding cassette transporter